MSHVVLFPVARAVQCDHGITLTAECPSCERLAFWRNVRLTILFTLPPLLAIGLILIWMQ